MGVIQSKKLEKIGLDNEDSPVFLLLVLCVDAVCCNTAFRIKNFDLFNLLPCAVCMLYLLEH
jgi:hypothetical protein